MQLLIMKWPPPSPPPKKGSQGNMLAVETSIKEWKAGISTGPVACTKIKEIQATNFNAEVLHNSHLRLMSPVRRGLERHSGCKA